MSLVCVPMLKLKFCNFDNILVTVSTGYCQNDNYQGSPWQKFLPNYNIYIIENVSCYLTFLNANDRKHQSASWLIFTQFTIVMLMFYDCCILLVLAEFLHPEISCQTHFLCQFNAIPCCLTFPICSLHMVYHAFDHGELWTLSILCPAQLWQR